tara:strand:+ start:6039 stop:6638 length:600 start_codon:yes stop_codon:yes gene_type:complete
MANLITTKQYKDYKQMDHNKDDAKIDTLVASISQMVKTYCGHSIIDFYSATKLETFDIEDQLTSEIFLTESPLVSVSSVKERLSIASSFTTLTENVDYYIDIEHDRIRRIDGDRGVDYWPQGFGSVQVVYNAGYAAVPADLKLAVYDLITYYLKEEYKTQRSIAGTTLRNEGSTSIRNDIGFPDHIKRVLDLYKIIDVV